jgi:diguanylate cyclase (GGDEF)-like protein/PAS domain S-box-containing protein
VTQPSTARRAGRVEGEHIEAIDDVPVGVLAFAHGGVVTVNRQWIALTGLGADTSAGSGWLAGIHHDDRLMARQFVESAHDADSVAEWRLLAVDGRDTVWVQATSGRMRSGERGAFVVALTEIDAHKANEAGLLHRALHDSLTGMLNKAAFMTRVTDALTGAAADQGVCAVLYLDLDHFKAVNDDFGHQCGDQLLVAVSRRIRALLRPTETVARLGGDEIGVLCPAVESETEAIRLAERIVDSVGQPFAIDDRVLHTSVSVGIALSDAVATNAGELVERADHAMYRAKAAGRAQWATATKSPATTPLDPRAVNDVLVGVVHARGRLQDLLGRLDPSDETSDRLRQASHALTQAADLLEGKAGTGRRRRRGRLARRGDDDGRP